MSAIFQEAFSPVTGYGTGYIEIAGKRYGDVLLLRETGLKECADLEQALLAYAEDEARPPLLLLGTGAKRVKPELPILTNVTVECMDTGAACRTFNVLLSEGRAVGAILVPV